MAKKNKTLLELAELREAYDRMRQFADSLSDDIQKKERQRADLVAALQAANSDRQAILDEINALREENRELREDRNAAVRQAAELRAVAHAFRCIITEAMRHAPEKN